ITTTIPNNTCILAMSGFADLWSELADEFQCSICLGVLSDAVDTKCKHTFCYQCINQWLTSQTSKQCPECRQSVVNRNRPQPAGAANRHNRFRKPNPKWDNIFIGDDVVVYRNRSLNRIISRLRAKCELEANGTDSRRRCGDKEAEELRKTVAKLVVDRDQCRKEATNWRREVDTMCGQIESLVTDRDQFKSEADKLRRELDVLDPDQCRVEAANQRRQVDRLTMMNKEMAVDRDQCLTNANKLRNEKQKLKANVVELRSEAHALRRQKLEVTADMEKYRLEVSELSRIKQQLVADRDRNQSEAESLRRQVEGLREQRGIIKAMPGYPISRFVDLRLEMAEEFRCSICLNLFEDAVDTKCKHTYCYQCIHQWLTSQSTKQCPECRQSVVNKYPKPQTEGAGNRTANRNTQYRKPNPKWTALHIGDDVLVYRNRKVNNFISILRVKCEWEANGCPHVMTVDEAENHSRRCPYLVCERCCLSGGRNTDHEKHKCVDALLRDRKRWRDQCGKEADQLRQRVDTLTRESVQLVADRDKYRSEADTLRRGLEVLDPDECRAESVILRRELDKLSMVNKSVTADRDECRTEADTLRDEKERAIAGMDEWRKKAADLRREADGLRADRSCCALITTKSMPGYPINRFIDLRPELAEEFRCSICLNLFEDAVDTKCKHTYCYQCIHQWLTSQWTTKRCPDCRQSVVSANRRPQTSSISSLTAGAGNRDTQYRKPNPKWTALFIGDDVVVHRNRRVNAFISRLRVKCEWESKGCPDVMSVDEAEAHGQRCRYMVCERCGLSGGRNSDQEKHICVDALLRDRKRWRDQCGKEADQLRQRVAAMGREADTLRREKERLATDRDKYSKEAAKLRNDIEVLDPDECRLAVATLRREVDLLRSQNRTLIATSDNYRLLADRLSREKQQAINSRDLFSAEAVVLRREKHQAVADRDRFRSEANALRAEKCTVM
ncbi:unnamed protein product, partial [Medioppia subpectinata]